MHKIIIGILLVAGCIGIWAQKHAIAQLFTQTASETVLPTKMPTATPPPISTPSPTAEPTPAPRPLPSNVNLLTPFTPQAPHANWKDPYGELCEEASVLMAMGYLKNTTIPSPEAANEQLLAIQAFEEKRFGYYKDTTIEETAVIFKEYFSYNNVDIQENPSIADIKRAIAQGRVVIAPFAGKELRNPHFQHGGPLYHMLVITGYTAEGQFITNDPGTKHGALFKYDQSVIMNAMHNWRTDKNIGLGKKVVLIAG